MKKIITQISLLILMMIIFDGCSRHHILPTNEQCDDDIKKIILLLKDDPQIVAKADLPRIRNLIKGAKIQQQHGDFNACIDKTNRALTLLKKDKISIENTKKN